jgi:hypothetical protein
MATEPNPFEQAINAAGGPEVCFAPQTTYSGWADQRLGHIYSLVETVQDTLLYGSSESGCLSDALKAIETADVLIEKHRGEAAPTPSA